MEGNALRVLITNNTLAARAGSELYVLDLALGLLRRGHNPVVYSTVLGDVAEALRRATVPVIDDLSALSVAPDVIHGHHHLEAMTAALHFPGVPMLMYCHGWLPWEERPPVHPAVRRYVAVDDLCAERLLTTPGIDPARVRTLYNGVDLARFVPRAPLPARPARALVFSNYATGDNYAATVLQACAQAGLQAEVAGLCSGRATVAPETLLDEYDLVFAKARCALEAMAVGCATVVADRPGLGGMVTSAAFDRLRALNFGVRTMQAAPITIAGVRAVIDAYDAEDAARVSARVRAEAGFDALVDRTIALYREALAEPGDVDAGARTQSASTYLRTLSPVIKSVEAAMEAQAAARAESLRTEQVAAALASEHLVTRSALATMHAERDAARAERDVARTECDAIRAERDAAREATQHACQTLDARVDDVSQALAAARIDIATLHGHLDEARRWHDELQRSRAWRAILAYRRLLARFA